MSRFVQFTGQLGPVFVIPAEVKGIAAAMDGKTMISGGTNHLVNESPEIVAKAIDDWFKTPQQQPILKQPELKMSQKRLDWLNSLKPGDKVVIDFPSHLKGVCEVVDVDYHARFQSGIGVRLAQGSNTYNDYVDSQWVNPVI